MFHTINPRAGTRAATLGLALAGALLAVSARAQEGVTPPPALPPDTLGTSETISPTPVPVRIPAPPAAWYDTTLALPVLVEPRPRDQIHAEINSMSDLRVRGQQRLIDARMRELRRKAQVDIKKTEITSTKVRIDLAKKEKRNADVKELEAERKKLEAQQRFLERARDLHASEADLAQATVEYAQARMDECRAELRLYEAGDLRDPAMRASAGARAAQVRILDLSKARADKVSTLVSREKSLGDRRRDVLDAYAQMAR